MSYFNRSASGYGNRNRDSIPAKWAQKKAAKAGKRVERIGRGVAREVKAFWDL